MTVALSVVTSDGIVVAADSRTSWGPRVLSDFTHKVVRVHKFAVTTYGWAFLQGRNIAAHLSDFAREVPPDASLDEVSQLLCEYMGSRFDDHVAAGVDAAPPAGVDPLGFLIAGFDDGVGEVLEVLLPSRQIEVAVTQPACGASWRGQTDVIGRLVKGIDYMCLGPICTAAGKEAQLGELMPEMAQLEYVIPFDSINLQDGIDFAVLAIRTTIDVQRLTYGTIAQPMSWPGVGGPIEIAVVTAQDGFAWVQRTELFGERPAGEAEGARS